MNWVGNITQNFKVFVSKMFSISDNFLSGYLTGKSLGSALSAGGNQLLNRPYQPPVIVPSSVRESYQGKDDISKTKNDFETLNLNLPFAQATTLLETPCQHIRKAYRELHDNADNVKEICEPFTTPTTTPSTITTQATITTSAPYNMTPKEKRSESILSTTPRGINCHKVMNSELNEKGEIIDTVWEVCDLPTTTTTTTRRPTTKSTTKTPTTTVKPLVRVCRPVMDSYLNDLGEIIDSVTEVCTMEPIK